MTTTEANDRMQRPLDSVDPSIADLLRDEANREATGLELIPSENLVSEAVLEAMGSVFTNKYAEGYPGKRYYGGCVADKSPSSFIDRSPRNSSAPSTPTGHLHIQRQRHRTCPRSSPATPCSA